MRTLGSLVSFALLVSMYVHSMVCLGTHLIPFAKLMEVMAVYIFEALSIILTSVILATLIGTFLIAHCRPVCSLTRVRSGNRAYVGLAIRAVQSDAGAALLPDRPLFVRLRD